jgi:TP901 family phage tail tape measure protein
MALVVGEAEVVIRANTKGLEAEMTAGSDPAFSSLGNKAKTAGEDAGTALTTGLSSTSKNIGKDTTAAVEKETSKIKGLYQDMGSKAKSSLSGLGVPASLLNGPAIAGVAFAAVAAGSVDLAVKMQSATASIATTEGISVKAAANIGDAFLSTAGKSEYSGQQLATAFAGVAGQLKATQGSALSTAQSMTFMTSATDLAKASGSDLTSTTSVLGGVLQAFQMNVTQAAGAANVLFNASNATGQSLSSLASSLERTRARLGATSPPMADLAALMVDMTKNGITGRAALTGLNGAMTALQGAATGTSKANVTAAFTLKEYGINALQANGQLTPMSTIIEKLAPKFATMTQAQQLSTATLIFGTSASKAMTAVIDGGVKSYQAATTEVTKHNAVQDAAALKAKTLASQMEIIKATVTDLATKFGAVLIPAFQSVVSAILPVINGLVSVIGWFEKGSPAAIVVAGTITAIFIPALVKMGIEAAASAGKAIASFAKVGIQAAIDLGKAAASVLGFGGTVATTDTAIEGENAAAAGSFEGMSIKAAAAVPSIGAAMTGITTEVATADTAIEAANVTAGASFTAMLGPIAAVAGALYLLKKNILDKLPAVFNSNSSTSVSQDILRGSGAISTKDDSQVKHRGLEYVWIGGIDGYGLWLTPAEAAKQGYGSVNTGTDMQTGGAPGSHGAPRPVFGASKTKAPDAYIAPVNTVATKAAASASKAAATAAARAQSTFTSEVLTAITLPHARAVDQLKALGVPANKAVQVLHDAVEPFNQAVKALEKAGFDASNAVKIADAGQKALVAEAKADAAANKAAATAAKKSGTASSGLGGIMVNGVMVSGAVYDAAIGAAYQKQTGTSLSTQKQPPTINFHPGAVVIHPAPGNDAASLLTTQGMLNDLLQRLTTEIRSGQNALGSNVG